jgi:hypothetical protein
LLLKSVVTVSDERSQVLRAALRNLMHGKGFAPEAFVAIANDGDFSGVRERCGAARLATLTIGLVHV